jgi:hypothetical protein
MSLGTPRKFSPDVELRRVEASAAGGADVCVYVLMPTLQELLGRPDFAGRDPIFLPGHRRPLDGWAIFGGVRDRGLALH